MSQHDPCETPARLRYDQMEALRKELRREMRDYVKSLNDAQEARVDAIKEDADEAKNLGIKARDRAMKPHECSQVETLAELRNSVKTWSGWWRGIMITVIVALLSLGGLLAGWWNDQSETKRDVSDLKIKMGAVDETVKLTKADFDSFRVTFEAESKRDKADQKRQIRDVAEAFTEVVKTEMKKSRRR